MPDPLSRRRAGGMSVGPMSLGVVLPTFPQGGGEPWRHLGRIAAEAEECGAGALWVCDHVLWPTPTLDCGVALTVAATATTACAVGTAVAQVPLRQPAAVAKLAGSVQVLSAGRVILGLGVGEHEGEYVGAGAEYARRGHALDRAIRDMRHWWSGGTPPYAMLPACGPIPVWVGGRSDAARRRAASLADGWMPLFLQPDRLREGYAHLAKEEEAAGRPHGAVTRSAMVFVSVGEPAPARAAGAAWLSTLYGLPPSRLERHVVAGTGAQCADVLSRYAEAGAEHLALFFASDDPLPQLAALGAHL